MAIDYKKLLKRCIYKWYDAEGCLWNAEDDETLTKEEIDAVEALQNEVVEPERDHRKKI